MPGSRGCRLRNRRCCPAWWRSSWRNPAMLGCTCSCRRTGGSSHCCQRPNHRLKWCRSGSGKRPTGTAVKKGIQGAARGSRGTERTRGSSDPGAGGRYKQGEGEDTRPRWETLMQHSKILGGKKGKRVEEERGEVVLNTFSAEQKYSTECRFSSEHAEGLAEKSDGVASRQAQHITIAQQRSQACEGQACTRQAQ